MDLSFPIVSDDAAGSTDQLEIEDEARVGQYLEYRSSILLIALYCDITKY